LHITGTMKNKIVNKKKSGVLVLLEENSKKSSWSSSKTVVMLKDVPLDVRKEEASKPLYLVRYE
jgi:hypothetical protein